MPQAQPGFRLRSIRATRYRGKIDRHADTRHWPARRSVGGRRAERFLSRRKTRGSARRRGDTEINRLAARFEHVVLTQDWHPAGHILLLPAIPAANRMNGRSRLRGSNPVARSLRPRHAGSAVATRTCDIAHAELVLRKGYHCDIDSYSAFYENDRKTHTGLAGYLRERGLSGCSLSAWLLIFACGFRPRTQSVRASVVVVVEDACRGIDVNGLFLPAGPCALVFLHQSGV